MNRCYPKLLLLVLTLSLSGCSWQEYFVVSNSSESEVIVQYTVHEDKKGFPIFGDQPLVYKLNSSKEIDWNSRQTVPDQDTSKNGFKLKLPANCALIFGELSNDHYIAYNQNFINDRHFNLEQLEIIRNKDTNFIQPHTFDSYFKKKKGTISLEIK